MHPKAPFSRQSSGHEDSPPRPQTNGQSLTSSLRQFQAEQLSCVFIQHYTLGGVCIQEDSRWLYSHVICDSGLQAWPYLHSLSTGIAPSAPHYSKDRKSYVDYLWKVKMPLYHPTSFYVLGRISIHPLGVQARTGLNQASTDLIADQTPAEATVVAKMSCSDGIYKAT